jgi:hypothetical protein
MREEYTVNNGNRPAGKTHGTGRFGELQDLAPTYKVNENAPDTALVAGTGVEINNNPNFSHNMIDRLSTPFDYVERILLQDFSGNKTNAAMDIAGENFFKNLFTFTFRTQSTRTDRYKNTYGITGFTMNYPAYATNFTKPDFTTVNSQFSSGEFFLDSFTYTPFIDYATTDPKVGIYSDLFLTDYNYGRYESSRFYKGADRKPQVDDNRRRLTTNLYQLRNLEEDIYNAKIAFREAIESQDEKVYIYTFCEHLATLFAKLSNIRMCHEIYGFKHPHHKWEGILALDIWYNLLYRNIDDKYPFVDSCMNMNPMVRKKIQSDGGGKYVQYDNIGKVYQSSAATRGLEWIEDESAPGFAYLWNDSLWVNYNKTAHDIATVRKECVSPRGVLTKLNKLIRINGVPTSDVLKQDSVTKDFPWFQ